VPEIHEQNHYGQLRNFNRGQRIAAMRVWCHKKEATVVLVVYQSVSLEDG
jgi:hypothetical protein